MVKALGLSDQVLAISSCIFSRRLFTFDVGLNSPKIRYVTLNKSIKKFVNFYTKQSFRVKLIRGKLTKFFLGS